MIFKMNSLTSERESERESEKEEEETVEKRENNTNAKKPRPRKGHQNSVLILSRSLEEEVCIRVRHMPPSPFKQQERLLRIILLALNLSHGEDQVHQGQLQQAVVEEVLRAPRPALLVTLLVPPHSLSTPLTSDTASMDTSSLLYLRLTVRCDALSFHIVNCCSFVHIQDM